MGWREGVEGVCFGVVCGVEEFLLTVGVWLWLHHIYGIQFDVGLHM